MIEPHGMLLGHRSYLVVRQPAGGEEIHNFRMNRIQEAQVLNKSFQLALGFSLENYMAFGVYHEHKQHGEVVWRFTPAAAEHTAEFRFHPTQTVELQSDGSLIGTFRAAGWLEIAWQFFQRGDKVEILERVSVFQIQDSQTGCDVIPCPRGRYGGYKWARHIQ